MNNHTDQVIIKEVLAGNTAAYTALVNRYRNMVFTLAYNIILNREDAEEVAQDIFVKAFNALRSFKEQSAFSTWLYRIVVNTALNKKKLRRFTTVDIAEQITSEEQENVYSLLQQHISRDQKKYIQLAMNALRDDERICMTMFYLNELPVNEIHELTGISVANIKVILHRGRKHLYDQLHGLLKTEIKNLI
ncbi:MAG TPA: RNA polymerase sigma factor [Chitinophagaceae bacterium]|nr:RNA polymerase sigma factor [Chitinophagaceae bacterium]